MYDKDNEIEDEENKDNNKSDKKNDKIDLTDKSVSMDKQKNDNNLKA
jgi:hypothetical protein